MIQINAPYLRGFAFETRPCLRGALLLGSRLAFLDSLSRVRAQEGDIGEGVPVALAGAGQRTRQDF